MSDADGQGRKIATYKSVNWPDCLAAVDCLSIDSLREMSKREEYSSRTEKDRINQMCKRSVAFPSAPCFLFLSHTRRGAPKCFDPSSLLAFSPSLFFLSLFLLVTRFDLIGFEV